MNILSKFNQNAVEKLNNSAYAKSSDYEKIKTRLSIVNKSMYRAELLYDPIALLEKSAITGRAFDGTEPKPKKKQRVSPDILSVSLKSEHKNIKPIKIYQLPKLPFGIHKNYNEEYKFIQDHFTFNDSNNELSKNLEVLTRKFRLNDKNNTNRIKSSTLRRKNKYKTSSEYFKMDSGYLICKKEQKIIKVYENNKKKNTEVNRSMTCARVEKDKIRSRVIEINTKPNTESNIIDRLYPTRDDNDSPVSNFYKTKYSALFEDSKTNRPNTGFRLKIKKRKNN